MTKATLSKGAEQGRGAVRGKDSRRDGGSLSKQENKTVLRGEEERNERGGGGRCGTETIATRASVPPAMQIQGKLASWTV